ncbi:MAG: phage virion morphogenesis protein [Bacteroidales bacterium]|jgi:phage gpG-like protein|nr:phage virion morphogenesis protein [Bacteroidales bacterium]
MTAEQFEECLKALSIQFNDYFNEMAPAIVGSVAVEYYKGRFDAQGWDGQGWPRAKRLTNPKNYHIITKGARKGQEVALPKAGNPLTLVGTGLLRHSIEVKESNSEHVVIWTNPSSFESTEPYGRVHNEGLRAGRGAGFIMPKRQFMGYTEELGDMIMERLEEELQKAIKN